jgi:PTH1 family peptidyl-tRNA hydrolase
MSAIRRLFGGFRSIKRAPAGETADHSGHIAWVIVGLGNPGQEYAHSRHNSGFMVLDRIAEGAGVQFGRRRFGGVTAQAEIGEAAVMLVKPQTFYNASGECVAGVLGYFKVPVSHLIVVHDELDLPQGRLQIKMGGGDAGNRGVRSIAEALASREFVRVRIGIGHPGQEADDKEYVLRPMRRAELGTARETIERAAEAASAVVGEGLQRAMGRYNQRE